MKRLFLTLFIILTLVVPGWAADWYVRPLVGGPYGAADGTSYNTAWAGFANIVWGGAGVVAGDTLWICGGTWGDVATDYQSLLASTTLTVGASGSSNSARIVIRGDADVAPDANANGHNGIVYHVTRGFTGNWVDTGTNSVFVHTTTGIGWLYEIVSAVWTPYTSKATVAAVATETFAPAAINTTSEEITTTLNWAEGTHVIMNVGGGTTGYTNGGLYYVKNINATTIQLETTPGGGAINLTSQGSGTHRISAMPSTTELNGFSAGQWWQQADSINVYAKTPSGTSPNTNHQINVYTDPFIIINGKDYITVKNITIHGGGGAFHLTNANYITIDNVNLSEGYKGIVINDNSDNCIVSNCALDQYGEGIYTVKATGYADNLTVDGNTITNVIETNRYGRGADCHSVGLQGGTGIIVRNNKISHGNSGIYLYNSTGYPVSDCTVYNNYIDDIQTGAVVAHGEGICTAGANVAQVTFTAYNNIVTNSTLGFALTAVDVNDTMQYIYNNTLYHNQINIGLSVGGNSTGVAANIRNNINASPFNYNVNLGGAWGTAGAFHIYSFVNGKAYATWTFTCDYNNYYPEGVFYYSSTVTYPTGSAIDFSTWSSDIGSQEANSKDNSDPLFINAGGSFALATDFKLQATSPCINTGTNTGITTDYEGAARPQ